MHSSEAIERVSMKKILAIYFDENLSWSYHVNNVIQSSYATLTSLHQFKRFTTYKVRKSFAETLLISKISYRLIVYSQLSKYQIQRLQKPQNRVASYVLGRYVKEDDLIKMLSWLPITELVDFCIANCCFSALHNPNWPKYLPLKLQVSKRTTRKDNEMMVERGEKTPLVIKFLLLSMLYQKLLE